MKSLEVYAGKQDYSTLRSGYEGRRYERRAAMSLSNQIDACLSKNLCGPGTDVSMRNAIAPEFGNLAVV